MENEYKKNVPYPKDMHFFDHQIALFWTWC